MKVTLKPLKELHELGWEIGGSDDGETVSVKKGGITIYFDASITREPHTVVNYNTIRVEMCQAYPELFTFSQPMDFDGVLTPEEGFTFKC